MSSLFMNPHIVIFWEKRERWSCIRRRLVGQGACKCTTIVGKKWEPRNLVTASFRAKFRKILKSGKIFKSLKCCGKVNGLCLDLAKSGKSGSIQSRNLLGEIQKITLEKSCFWKKNHFFSTMCNTVNVLLWSSHRGVHVNSGSGTLEEQVVQ